MYQLAKISNGWLVKKTWIEEGQPQEETLYCGKYLKIATEAINIWDEEGILAAFEFLGNKLKEAAK